MPDIQVKRVYEPAVREDGYRVLVDRVWPRGVTKEKANTDLWLKEVAPGTALRKWFGHDPAKWNEFKERYFSELRENREPVDRLLDAAAKNRRVTLLFSARDEEHNQAVALREFLLGKHRRAAR